MMSETEAETVLVENDNGVRIITMNRPERLNALSDTIMRRLADTVADAARDASVGCARGRDVLQVLAAFELPRSSPATLIVKCDKVLCAGGAIRNYAPKVSLAATGLLQPAPPCPSKGVVGVGQDFCVDFVQSKRDGSGDTYLFVLMVRDARMSI